MAETGMRWPSISAWQMAIHRSENPSIDRYLEARQRLEQVGIAELLDDGAST
jgi:hypothetical protein